METYTDSNIQELMRRVHHTKIHSVDIVCPSEMVMMSEMDNSILYDMQGALMETIPNKVAHGQLSDKLGIPKKYYDKMKAEQPQLLASNVNTWLRSKEGKNYMLRMIQTEDESVLRAVVSNRYLALDNYDVLLATMKAVRDVGANLEMKISQITERRMYVKFVSDIEVEAKGILKDYTPTKLKGDHPTQHRIVHDQDEGICAGFQVRNSETGFGLFSISPLVWVKKCANGYIGMDESFDKMHIGSQLEVGNVAWSQETLNKNMELIMSQVRDFVQTYCSADYLNNWIDRVKSANDQLDVSNLIQEAREIIRPVAFNEEDAESILNHFISGGDHTKFGVAQAVTRYAQEKDGDTRYDYERSALQVMNLS